MVSDSAVTALYGGGYVATALLTGGLCYWVILRTEMRSRRWFGALLAIQSVWATTAAAGVFVSGRSVQVALGVVWVVAALSTVWLWLVFAVHYTGDEPLSEPAVRLLGLLYLGLLAVAVTIPVHDLYHSSMVLRTEPFPHLETTLGPVRVVALGYTAASVTLGTRRLWRMFVNTRYTSRTQLLSLVVAISAGVAPAVASRAEFTPVSTYDHTAFGISAFVIVVTYGVFRHSFVELAPVARDAVVERLGDPLLVLDREERLVDYNDAAETAVPDLSPEFVGTDVATLVTELGGAADGDCPAEVSLETGGERRHYSVVVSEVGTDGLTRGYAVLLRNITERRAREQELEAARQRLERSNERLDEFASVVSHDLRNPLNVASLQLELVREEHDIEQLEKVAQAHDRMERMIDSLLTLARSGERLDDPDPVSLAEVADSCWQTVSAPEATLAVEVDRTVRADRDRLRRLLENLFRNTLDHGPSDVAVTVGALPDGFYVADDGPGIPEAERERALDHGFTTAADGTGLGLAIVDSIADAHGWETTVTESETGGTRVEFAGVQWVETGTRPA